MRDIVNFSANVVANFDNDYNNMVEFNTLMMDASHRVFGKYSKEETQTIIRNQFDKIFHINYKEAKPQQRRQAYRKYQADYFALVEDVLVDKMNSGWTDANALFMQFVEEINLAEDDKAEFYVNDPSLLVVSKYSGDHHDVVRQKLLPGKSYTIDVSPYVIKVYAEFEEFQLGRIDWADYVDRMYRSIEQYRYSALYTAFMSMDSNLPTDMILNVTPAEATKEAIIEHIESVKAATGKEAILVGTNVAIRKLQAAVPYAMFSNEMKNEEHQKGSLGLWEGYTCLGLDRVNVAGTRTSVFNANDNKKIFILPIDSDFRPIKRVNAGELVYLERGMDGLFNQDMTGEAMIYYKEGIGVVINELFGEIYW